MCSFEIVYCDVRQTSILYSLVCLLIERVLLNSVMFHVEFRHYKLSLNQVWITSIINTSLIFLIFIHFNNHECYGTSFHLIILISLTITSTKFARLYLYFKFFKIDSIRRYLLCTIECQVLTRMVCLIMLVAIVQFG